MQHRAARPVRGWAAALLAVSLAAASHGAAGGQLPPGPLLVLVLAVSGCLCTALAGRGWAWWRTAAAVAASQGLYHAAFGWGAHAHGAAFRAAGTGADAGAHAGHDPAAHVAAVLAAGPGAGPAEPAAMVWAHAAAAVATVLLLRRGEAAAARLAGALPLARPARILAWRPVLAAPAPAQPPAARPAPAHGLGVPLLALRHRGPPVRPAA